jgi:hypothetical protein
MQLSYIRYCASALIYVHNHSKCCVCGPTEHVSCNTDRCAAFFLLKLFAGEAGCAEFSLLIQLFGIHSAAGKHAQVKKSMLYHARLCIAKTTFVEERGSKRSYVEG